ncbi:MAG TPA: hypothetical protein VIO36_13665 [Anaerolineaceae bacterium]
MRRSLLLRSLAGMIILSVAACLPILGMDVAVRLKPDQAWTVKVEMKLAASAAAMIDQSYFTQLEQEFTQEGIDAEIGDPRTDSDGNLIVPISLSGSGFDKLNEAVFSNSNTGFSAVENKPGRVVLRGSLDGTLGMYPITFRVTAARVISANGQKDGLNSVVWTNPQGVLQAEFDTNSNLALYLIAAGALLLVVGSVVAIAQRSKPARPAVTGAGYAPFSPSQPAPPVRAQLPSSGQRFCVHCGQPHPAAAGFCPHCGKHTQ